MIRPALSHDLPEVVSIENSSFATDRISRRSFRHLLTRANGVFLVDDRDGTVAGYVIVLFHRGTSLARLYSIAVNPAMRGQGVGQGLLAAAEQAGRYRHCAYLRLEVDPKNLVARALYGAAGYREFDVAPDYYEDRSEALRMQKCLAPGLDPQLAVIPFFEQTLDFTCGPAALLMAMGARAADVACSIAAMIDGAYLHAALGAETPDAARAIARVEAYLTLALTAG